MTAPKTRVRASAAGFATAAILAGGLLAGCGNAASVSCGLSDCTITFERDEVGSAYIPGPNVAGMTVELVSATDTEATLSVGGQETSIPVDGSRKVAGFTVSILSITDEHVVVLVNR
jgi:hypothetical protein